MGILAISAAVIAFLALVFAYSLASWVGKTDEGTDRMKELSGHIKMCAVSFLKWEYKTMIPVILVLFIIIGFVIGWITAAFYAFGALFSVLAGFFGMIAAVRGSARTANAAEKDGVNPALKAAFRSGAVMGLCMAGLGLLGIGGVFVVFGIKAVPAVAGFGLGASTAALFACAGGSIYFKAAEAGAVLIGRAEKGISEGDPRNPAVIAGLAGRFAGNAAGMGADLFESYAGSIIAAFCVAAITKSIHPVFGYPFDLPATTGAVFPLLIYAAGILGTIAGTMFVRGNHKSDPAAAVNAGKYLCNTLVVLLSFLLSWIFFGNFNCAISVMIGMLTGAAAGKVTNTYTFGSARHLKKIATHFQNGSFMIGEFGIGMLSTLRPMILLSAGVLAANSFAGLYGITLAAVGLLSTAGMVASIDAFAPVSGNGKEIVRMARLSGEAGAVADKLDSTGKAHLATGKGYAVGASALTALALLTAYGLIAELKSVNLLKPAVMACLLFGSMIPVFFSALTMSAAGRTAFRITEEVKRQFHTEAGILSGTVKPGYAECAHHGTKSALKGIIAPGVFALIAPLAVGILMGTEALGGLLAGALLSGVLTSVILANTGGVWNHEEKYMAEDPFKDAAANSVHVFLKLMAMTALVFAPLLSEIGGLLK